jgi:hypothetical protein
VDADERHSSGARGRSARRDRGRSDDAEVDALNGLIAKLERRIELEEARGPAVGELERAETRLRPFELERQEAHKAAAEFNAALDRVYVDGIAARRTIRGFVQQEGVGAAMREIASHPEQFGEIRGAEHGPIRSSERKEAQRHAVELSRASHRYFHRVDVARTHVADHRDARTAVSRAEGNLRTIDTELSKGPGAALLRLQIHERARALQPSQKQEVGLRLSPSQRLLLGTGLAVGMAFVRDQGHER